MSIRNKITIGLIVIFFGVVAYIIYSLAMIASLNSAVTNGELISIRRYYGRLTKLSWYLGTNPLETAITSNNKMAFSLLLESGADPHSRGTEGMPIIHRTCMMSDSFWLSEVLKFGGDPNLLWANSLSWRPNRPMLIAMGEDNFHLVPILVHAGASLTDQILVNKGVDYSPIGYAAVSGPEAVDTILFLLDRGAMPTRNSKNSCIDILIQGTDSTSWRWPITEWFEEHGMDLRKTYWNGTEWIIPALPRPGQSEERSLQ
jgi:hypothetical protein